MKKVLFNAVTVMVLGTAVTSSCSKDSRDMAYEHVPVQFGSNIKTRAADDSWAVNDRIGVFMLETGTAISYEPNVEYSADAAGSGAIDFSIVGSNVYYPMDGSGLDFFAYYPHNGTLSGPGYLIDVDVSSARQANQATIDLMWSGSVTNATKASGSVNLPFDHLLSKVVINIVKGNGLTGTDFSAMTMKMTGMTIAAEFSPLTGSLTPAIEASSEIVPLAVTAGTQYEAIVLPKTVADMGMEFALNDGSGSVFNWTKANEVFTPGFKYTYTMTINVTGVTFTCSIADWTNENRPGSAS